jgi:hypothetical protein
MSTIPKFGICDRCQQYESDCEGRCADEDMTATRRRLEVTPTRPRTCSDRPTLRGLGADLTIRTPAYVFRVQSDVGALDSTGSWHVMRTEPVDGAPGHRREPSR